MKAQMGTGRPLKMKQTLKEGQNPSLRVMCEVRENRGLVTIGEASDTVRGMNRFQYPSRVNEKGFVWWLKAWVGTSTRKIVEVK